MKAPPSHPARDPRCRAVVLSAGGAKGAYEVGVMKALFEGASPSTGYRPLAADLYSGSSIGAYNAAFMASHSARRVALGAVYQLERVWREQITAEVFGCGNGVFRLRGIPPQCWSVDAARQLAHDTGYLAGTMAAESIQFVTSTKRLPLRVLNAIDLSALFEPQPFHRLVADTLSPAGMLDSPARLLVVATNFKSGRPRVFEKRDIMAEAGFRAVCASAAIPGIFPAIEIDGEPFTDGSVAQNTPLLPAVIAGADELHVIFLSPRIRDVPLPILPNTFDTLYRLLLILSSYQMHTAAHWLKHLARLRESGFSAEEIAELSGLLKDSLLPIFELKNLSHSLRIHKYSPEIDLGGADGLVDFSVENIDLNITRGYRDAVYHDCRAAGCVLAGDRERASSAES